MTMQYQESFRFSNGHSLGVTCLSFSPDTTLLASGGIEGNICVWDMKTKKLLASSAPVGGEGVGVLSCVWKEGRNDSFMCGIQDGSIAEVTLTSSKISIVGIRAHRYPVEKLLVQGDRMVSGAQSQVRVWKAEADEKWAQIAELDPPLTSINPAELIVTGLFFKKAAPDPEQSLLVAYMHHGMMLYDAQSYALIRAIPYRGIIGNCDLHPNGSALAISNCKGGFEVYRFEAQKRQRFPPGGEQQRSLPIVFAHNGNAILTGSSVGHARLWDVGTKFIHKHFLSGKGTEILAIAACYNIEPNKKKDALFIATGITSAIVPCDIIIWAAKHVELKTAGMSGGANRRNSPPLTFRLCHRLSQLVTLVLVAFLLDVIRRVYYKEIRADAD